MATAPWKKAAPASSASSTRLTPENIAWARNRAHRAGRRYPNLVDNMAAARRQQEQVAAAAGPDPSHRPGL